MSENRATSRDDHSIVHAFIERYARMYEWIEGVLMKNDYNSWVDEMLNSVVVCDPQRALRLIDAIAQTTEDEFVIGNLAAGPLENLLKYHGAEVIDDIERMAKSESARILDLLSQIYDTTSDEVWNRINVLLSSNNMD